MLKILLLMLLDIHYCSFFLGFFCQVLLILSFFILLPLLLRQFWHFLVEDLFSFEFLKSPYFLLEPSHSLLLLLFQLFPFLLQLLFPYLTFFRDFFFLELLIFNSLLFNPVGQFLLFFPEGFCVLLLLFHDPFDNMDLIFSEPWSF